MPSPELRQEYPPERVPATSRWRTWLLRALLAEKVVQHAFITWAFASDRFGIREDVAVDYRWLMVLGAGVGILFGVALAGHLAGRGWALWLALGLAVFDIVGEFVAQGGLSIVLNVSFIVAIIVLLIAWTELRRNPPEIR